MRQIMLAAFAIIVAIGPATAADYKLGSLVIENPWTRATPPGAKVGGGYLIVENTGTEPDRLISVAADGIAEKIQLHEMAVTNGVMTMKELEGGVLVPAAGKVEFKPGGYHVMFIGLKSGFKQGDHIKARLTFEHAGGVDVDFEVGSVGQTMAMPMH
jgi:copper(I)-binding protein